MKLVATDMGQVLQLVVMEEMRPLSGLYMPKFLRAIWDRYQFVSGPQNFDADIAAGAKFKTGHLQMEGRDIAIQELGFYNDGVVVSALTTADADVVTDDLLDWATREFKLRDRRTSKQRRHMSSLVVDMEGSLDSALKEFNALAELFAKTLSDEYGVEYAYNVNGITWVVDPLVAPHLFNTKFQIERRLNFPFKQNRYFSQAPLKTEAHLHVLERIEKLLAA